MPASLGYSTAMRRAPLLLALALLASCGKDPDERVTSNEADLSAKAVADVDAAMAEARRAPALPVVPPPAAEAAAVQAEGEAAAAADGQ
jgi:hypothetical protein